MEIQAFITALSSKAPTPGGGGAAALAGSLSAALCAMVANLTSGKAKYAAVQPDIERALAQAQTLAGEFLSLIEADARHCERMSNGTRAASLSAVSRICSRPGASFASP